MNSRRELSYLYHKLRKAISKFCHRHFELIVKYHVSLKKLLQQGISDPEFYGDLVYKYKIITRNLNFGLCAVEDVLKPPVAC